MAPSWRYLFHDLRSDAFLADLPLTNVALDWLLPSSGTSSFSAALPLGDRRVRQLDWRAATEAAEVCVYSECDGEIVTGHVVWDTVYRLSAQTLTLTGSDLWTYLARRALPQSYTFTDVDQFDIVRRLVADMVAATGAMALEVDPVGTLPLSGIHRTVSYDAGNAPILATEVQNLAKLVDGFDYRIAVTRDEDGTMHRKLLLGHPRLGRAGGASPLKFTHPRGAIEDFEWPRQGSMAANRVIVVGANQTRVQLTDATRIAAGEVLLETVKTISNVADPARLLAYAAGVLATSVEPHTVPTVQIRRDAIPALDTLELGDDAPFAIEDPVYFPGPWDDPHGVDRRLADTLRLTGVKVTPAEDKVELVFAGDAEDLSADSVLDGNGDPYSIPNPGGLPTSIGPPSDSGLQHVENLAQTTGELAQASGGGGGLALVQRVELDSISDSGAHTIAEIPFTVHVGCSPMVLVVVTGTAEGDGSDVALEAAIGANVTVDDQAKAVETVGTTSKRIPFALHAPGQTTGCPAGDWIAYVKVTAGGSYTLRDVDLQLWAG